jgi:hypothetical protein
MNVGEIKGDKMPKFKVTLLYISGVVHEIDAETAESAQWRVNNGEGRRVDRTYTPLHYTEYPVEEIKINLE